MSAELDDDFEDDFEDVDDDQPKTQAPVSSVQLERNASGNVEVSSLLNATGGIGKKFKERAEAAFGTTVKDSKHKTKKSMKRIKSEGQKYQKHVIASLSLDDKDNSSKIKQVESDLKDSLCTIKAVRKDKEIVDAVASGKSLMKDLQGSKEAKDLVATSGRLLKGLQDSDTGKMVLNAMGTILEDRGDELLAMGDQIMTQTAEKLKASSQGNKKQLEGTAETFMTSANAALDKVASDERTKKVVDAGLKHGVKMADKAKGLANSLKDKKGAIASSIKSKIDWIKEHEVGQVALRNMTQALKTVEDKGGVNYMLKESQEVLADPKRRQEFFKKIKDTALNYLMKYLPQVKVPTIKGSKDGVDYELSDISLTGFKVPADKVSLLVVKGTELHLRADNIVFNVKGIKWQYQQNYFPYLQGKGLVDCASERTRIIVVFRLELAEKILQAKNEQERAGNFIMKGKFDGDSTHKLLQSLQKEQAPLLTMDTPGIRLEHLSLSIKGSRMSWLYNAVVSIFSKKVKAAMQRSLVNAIQSKSAILLDALNALGKDYWPLLLKVADDNVDKAEKVGDRAKQYATDIYNSTQTEGTAMKGGIAGTVAAVGNTAKEILQGDAVKSTREKVANLAKRVQNSDTAKSAAEIGRDAAQGLSLNIRIAKAGEIIEQEGDLAADGDDAKVEITSYEEEARPAEYTVDFASGPLGLGLACENGYTVVKRLNSDKFGRKLQAELLGVQAGDVVYSIAGTRMKGWNLKKISKLIKAESRPLEMLFRTDLNPVG